MKSGIIQKDATELYRGTSWHDELQINKNLEEVLCGESYLAFQKILFDELNQLDLKDSFIFDISHKGSSEKSVSLSNLYVETSHNKA